MIYKGRHVRPFFLYAWHGRQLEGESPLEEEVVPTLSRRQRRRREAGSEGSRKANPCTEEHEPHRRRGGLGEPARHGEARHHQEAVR